MKILKSELKQIIKEELSAVLEGEELNELAASPFEPDPGSVNWCEEQGKLYYNLIDQAEHRLKMTTDKTPFPEVAPFDGWDDRADALRSQARDIKTKMEANGCPDAMAPREPDPSPESLARGVSVNIMKALERIEAESVVQGSGDGQERAEAALEPYMAIDNGTATPEDFAEFARRHPEIEDKFAFSDLVLSRLEPQWWQWDE